MNHPHQLARAPGKPVMLYDGDCHFCTLWVRRWEQCTGDAVSYVPFQDQSVRERFPELSHANLEQAVHFIATNGSVYTGAAAVFQSLAANPCKTWPLRLYRRFPVFASAAELGYRFVARHRSLASGFTHALWGRHVEHSSDLLVRWLFLKGLGTIYLIAFVSLWVQIPGLVGQHGILPVTDLMSQAHRAVEASGTGIDRFRLLPTLSWFSASDGFLKFQCAAGTVLAALLIAGIAPRICLTGLWLLYLSVATVGQVFFGYQWDNLLLEVGLLAILLAPCQFLPRPAREAPPSRTALWLLRLLLFKLMFLSGVVKLDSGDPVWRNLTALTRHYETQPLPTWIAWHAHHLPLWFQKTSCGVMFAIELAAPFFIFAPRRARMLGGLSLAALQILILLSGNYTFFNWLTLLLCVLLLDDFTLERFMPRKLTQLYKRSTKATPPHSPGQRWRSLGMVFAALLIGSISWLQVLGSFRKPPRWASPVVDVYRWVSPFRSINSYGLFAVMTTERVEIIIEGSNDGQEWREYEFPYKPGALNRRPAFVAPHQPRLDWQMWFAALSEVRQNPWFVSFCVHLLQGSPEVLALLDNNPFPDSPPKYIRARLYDYQFTSPQERQRTGNWWKREFEGEYLPPISLEMLQPVTNVSAEQPRP